jgi:AcrR family transcriptional regulator
LIESVDGHRVIAVSAATTIAGAEAGTPLRLLDATERLVGEQGVEAVSLRAINAAAGANVAAAHYHFGSKEGLVAAVLERRMTELAAERFALLAPIESRRRPEPRSVVEAFVLPFVRLQADEAGRRYARFLAALDRAGAPWWDLVAAAFAPQWDRFEPVLQRAFPSLPEPVFRFRVAVVSSTLLGPVAAPRGPDLGLSGAALESAVVDAVCAVLAAPITPFARRSTR